VDVKLIKKFEKIIPLAVLKETAGLKKMMVTQKGARLSIQPITSDEWQIVNMMSEKDPNL
jgi:predicted RNA-binding protein with PUA-like domain